MDSRGKMIRALLFQCGDHWWLPLIRGRKQSLGTSTETLWQCETWFISCSAKRCNCQECYLLHTLTQRVLYGFVWYLPLPLQMNRKGLRPWKYFPSSQLKAFWRHVKGRHLPERFCRSALLQGTINRTEIVLLTEGWGLGWRSQPGDEKALGRP